jgi:ABC-type transport system involved in multi-copper enzyme maturation permease subunit
MWCSLRKFVSGIHKLVARHPKKRKIMSEIQFNIQQEFREKQEKYIYYLIALSVSAIGFSIYKTENQSLTYSQIPLALAVIFWSVSIFCGLKFLKYVINNLYANNDYFEITKGRHPSIGNNPDLIKSGIKGFQEAMEINSKAMKRYFKFQSYLFYFGIILFIVWHVLEMYLKTEMINMSCH